MISPPETVLEIDLTAIEHNYNFIKSKLNNSTKFLAVVKAFAYGSDACEVALKLQELNVDYFAVAYTDEGIALRKAGIHTPILVLHPQPNNFKLIIDNCLEPSLYSKQVLEQFITVAKKLNQTDYPVHLKFNTGLNRLGFTIRDCDFISQTINKQDNIKALSVFSHLAASEDDNETKFTIKQINLFKDIANTISPLLKHKPFLHLCNTSGTLNYPEAHFDMIRSGIGLYGFGNDPKFDQHLKPISTLKTRISQIQELAINDTLGYNRAFTAKQITRTATLPLGHADGINRIFGNGTGYVFINNQKAPIIGNVCMDMLMIDITNINCKEGDEVIIFNDIKKASQLAEDNKSISYELITSVSQRVKRTFKR